MKSVKLLSRVIICGEIETKTGLHIGGSPGALAIGNVDLPVIRDERTNHPYIPGSSLKGKMRSLSEKWTNAPQNTTINKGKEDGSGRVEIHSAKNSVDYNQYWVNPLFGITGDGGDWVPAPNRLIVRDVPMLSDPDKKPPREGSIEHFQTLKTDLPFTEVKWEAAIDRVTSAATPRQIERVPAGAVFGQMEMVFSVYLKEDVSLFGNLLTAMQLLEDDYLGGHGSRGSGKIKFRALTVTLRSGKNYEKVSDPDKRFEGLTLSELVERKVDLAKWITENLPK